MNRTATIIVSIMMLVVVLIPAGFSSSPTPNAQITQNKSHSQDVWGYRIVFDRSHSQIYSIYDTGFCGYSDLAEIMKNKGFRVEETAAPLLKKIAGLTSNDILFLGLSKTGDYNSSEIEAIHDYIRNGGNAIFVGEHNNANSNWKMSLYQNHVLASMGVQFRDDEIMEYDTSQCIIPPEENEDMKSSWWFFASGRGPLDGLNKVPIYAAASIDIESNATPILSASPDAKPSEAVVAALINYGSGKAVCIGDSEVMWNGGGYMSINYANAARFVSNMLDLLVKPQNVTVESDYDLFTGSHDISVKIQGNKQLSLNIDGGTAAMSSIPGAGNYTISVDVERDGHMDFISGKTVIKRINFFAPPGKGNFSVLIDERGSARGVDGGGSSILKFARIVRDGGAKVFASSSMTGAGFDSCIMVNPVRNVTPEWVLNGKRGIIAADFYTTLPYEKPWSSYIRAGWYNWSDIPVKKLFKMANATLSEKLVCNAGKSNNIFYLNGTHSFGFEFPVFNAVSIDSPTKNSLARGEKGSWADSYNFFWTRMTDGDEEDSNNTAIISYSGNIMLLGCAESLTDQFSEENGWRYLAESLTDWLDMRVDISGITGNNLKIVTTERAIRVGLMSGGSILWKNIDKGKAIIPLAEGTGGTEIVVEYTYGDGVAGSYHYRIMQNSHEIVIPLILLSTAGLSIALVLVKYRSKKRRNSGAEQVVKEET